ncbi:MAG: ATP synthase F1 subunit epsilon [Acidimicrobiia bacterium]|jgi:F-type H+-transporting ATPase subunit epsilon
MPLDVQVVSPERVLFEGVADMVVCRPADGDIAFLPGHVPYLGALDVGAVRVILNPEAAQSSGQGAGEVAFAVHGGFVEVSNDHVTVLSDLAEAKDQIDVARAQQAKASAEAALAANPEDEAAQAALDRATTRVHVATEL